MIVLSLQRVEQGDTRTLLAVREERIVRDVVRLIAERLPQLTEQEPPEWLRFIDTPQEEGDGDGE